MRCPVCPENRNTFQKTSPEEKATRGSSFVQQSPPEIECPRWSKKDIDELRKNIAQYLHEERNKGETKTTPPTRAIPVLPPVPRASKVRKCSCCHQKGHLDAQCRFKRKPGLRVRRKWNKAKKRGERLKKF